MPNTMKNTPFNRVTRASHLLNLALFGVLPIVLILASALYWGAQRILTEEGDKVTVNFSQLVGYIREQETFLQRLRLENRAIGSTRLGGRSALSSQPSALREGAVLFKGREFAVSMPFSLACEAQQDCPDSRNAIFPFGEYLANSYTAFWTTSHYPAAEVFLIDLGSSFSVSVPAVDAYSGYSPLSEAAYFAVTDLVRTHLREGMLSDITTKDERVLWLRSADLPQQMVGVLAADIPADAWREDLDHPPSVYGAILFSMARINTRDTILRKPSYSDMWLLRNGTLLLGSPPVPSVSRSDREFERSGLLFKRTDPSGTWTGIYRISYQSLLSGNPRWPISAALLLLFGILGGMAFLRWYNRRVVAPARIAQETMVESEAFSRAVIETSPIALCVLNKPDGRAVFGNRLAQQWLNVTPNHIGPFSNTDDSIGKQVLNATEPGVIDEFVTADGRPLYVAYTPTRYKGQSVVLCAFADIRARKTIESALAKAKQDADAANEAKSTFLATMSHEIRTPLYGVLGTLELLELTSMTNEQRQHVHTIMNSSAILLQLISDILDITKIEAGQLDLERVPFDPRQLVEQAVSGVTAMATQKGLFVFSYVDTDIPAQVLGDDIRIRQILNNLLNNAVKFTDSGHVIARLRVVDQSADKVTLVIQVADSGIGIELKEQERLFTPFYQIDGQTHTVRGAGLGLSICARLADLMHGEMRVVSDLGLGSSFSLTLTLNKCADSTDRGEPQLDGIRVFVRTPHRELTSGLCEWLNRWHATASAASHPLPTAEPDDVLLDVLLPEYAPPENWKGIYLSTADGVAQTPGAQGEISPHSRNGIAFAIEHAIRGTAADLNTDQAQAFDPLGLRVLVAEDNPINQATLCQQLEQLGCRVVVANDGAEALAIWQPDAFDVVLTDVNMPRMNGYELASALRSRGSKIPIIGVTANAMREEEQRCMAAGMTSWLVKPIGLRLLRKYLTVGAVANAQQIYEPHPNTTRSAAESAMPEQKTAINAGEQPQIDPKFRQLFLETMQADIRTLGQACAQKGTHAVLSTLHRIRGAMVVVELKGYAKRCEAIERSIRSSGLLPNQSREINSLINDLQNMLDKY